MLITRFEELKNRINNLYREGAIEGLDYLNIMELVLDTENYIENNELYYRINEFKNILDMIEEAVNEAEAK